MSYAIVFGEGALDGLPDWLPHEAVDLLERELNYLAADPVNRSERIPASERVLHHPRGQRYRFFFNYQRQAFLFAVYFVYMENESDLKVYDVEVTGSI